jgi:8-oxo-dGTP diphosphatase
MLVVCAVVFKEGRVLLARRKSGGLKGFWEFPGGKIESEESETEAIKRELLEELSMKVEVQKRLTPTLTEHNNRKIELIPYVCRFVSMAREDWTDHDKIEWVELQNLTNYKMPPADIPIVYELFTLLQ